MVRFSGRRGLYPRIGDITSGSNNDAGNQTSFINPDAIWVLALSMDLIIH